MSKGKAVEVAKTGRLAGFDAAAWATEYIPVEEVMDIKRGFDLFDHDGGGSIDPRGNPKFTQNSRSPSIPWVSKPRLKQCTQ